MFMMVLIKMEAPGMYNLVDHEKYYLVSVHGLSEVSPFNRIDVGYMYF